MKLASRPPVQRRVRLLTQRVLPFAHLCKPQYSLYEIISFTLTTAPCRITYSEAPYRSAPCLQLYVYPSLVHGYPFAFKGLEIKGVYGREMFETWYKMVAMIQSGLDLSPIITHHYAAEEFETAFATMISGQSGKIILDWAA